jgi:hypothetical protein
MRRCKTTSSCTRHWAEAGSRNVVLRVKPQIRKLSTISRERTQSPSERDHYDRPSDMGSTRPRIRRNNNKTYVNGQAGSIYKQGIPLVNPNRRLEEWETYDVVWTAPTFNEDG